MASSMAWCHEQGLSYDCLDAHVRPMIEVSDNFQTGVVVDIITGGVRPFGYVLKSDLLSSCCCL